MPSKDRNAANIRRAGQKRDEKSRFTALFNNTCAVCGGTFHPAAFDFHHLNPSEKHVHITGPAKYKVREAEVKKCIMLCANCHRTIHAKLDLSL